MVSHRKVNQHRVCTTAPDHCNNIKAEKVPSMREDAWLPEMTEDQCTRESSWQLHRKGPKCKDEWSRGGRKSTNCNAAHHMTTYGQRPTKTACVPMNRRRVVGRNFHQGANVCMGKEPDHTPPCIPGTNQEGSDPRPSPPMNSTARPEWTRKRASPTMRSQANERKTTSSQNAIVSEG